MLPLIHHLPPGIKQLPMDSSENNETSSSSHLAFQFQNIPHDGFENNPIGKFKKWLSQSNDFIKQLDISMTSLSDQVELSALKSKLFVANMAADFVTVNANTLQPSSRKIICKDISERGFTFFTNTLTSKKGMDISTNNKVALNFMFTLPVIRQIRVEGIALPVSKEELGESYTNEEPEYRINIHTCPQSQPSPGRDEMWKEFEEIHSNKSDLELKSSIPAYWGGYLIVPHRFEFYQEGLYRMADRVEYVKEEQSNSWKVSTLYP
ncbi:hypothetical protein FDP41_005851 [Naegleria fowleri]|uniref:pyridoxal 5'-phosphate synthase n=1 Tax=Naegleria fowleri TaxID=5763 RepID=A0A6A5BLQ5_NAEFO|nr:uncharacterized protein FDP41_005851 [Naegleria fowleri]KAF0975098.1 hypothetical protein FDP41_005851 [Naegleria fowleri]CAG4712223.1 unnamed protein product [Naegleria fowleri]